jgi:hypothetical protein
MDSDTLRLMEKRKQKLLDGRFQIQTEEEEKEDVF